MNPTSTGYLDTEGLHLYYETFGSSGAPVVLLHGGVLSIHQSWDELIPVLAEHHLVIGLDQQAHGRSSDTDRPITPATLAGDVVALLDHLGLDRAHVIGHSMGAAVALELGVHHGDRLLSVVPISGSVRPEGMHSDFSSPEAMAASTRMPTAEEGAAMQTSYAELSPTPDGFGVLMDKMQNGAEFQAGWSDDLLAGIDVPVLVAQGDHDFITVEHAALMLDLIPDARLLVLPGTTHMQASHRANVLGPALSEFFAR